MTMKQCKGHRNDSRRPTNGYDIDSWVERNSRVGHHHGKDAYHKKRREPSSSSESSGHGGYPRMKHQVHCPLYRPSSSSSDSTSSSSYSYEPEFNSVRHRNHNRSKSRPKHCSSCSPKERYGSRRNGRAGRAFMPIPPMANLGKNRRDQSSSSSSSSSFYETDHHHHKHRRSSKTKVPSKDKAKSRPKRK